MEKTSCGVLKPRILHRLLWDCYLSGQMDGAALEREIAADPGFADFVSAHQRP